MASNSSSSESRCYLVRTFEPLVERGVVGVGWVDFNFAEIADAEETIRQIAEQQGIGRYGNQIRRFHEMSEGDIVVAPLPYSVAIGRVEGGLVFDPADYNSDRANQRKVNFPRDADGRVVRIPRVSFSEAFQRRLKVQGIVVNDLTEFGVEIQTAIDSVECGVDHSWVNQLDREVAERKDEFKNRLLENIQCGRTNLVSGGAGLEELVCELLKIEGYDARVLSKKHFSSFADADVLASRSDRFASVKLLVQVKHHQGASNGYGIRQLDEIQRAHQGEYDNHQAVFVTSASVPVEVRKMAEEAKVTVIDGRELAEWITENIESLSPGVKSALGVFEVPAVIWRS